MQLADSIKRFLNRHHATGWLILLAGSGLLLQIIAYLVFSGLGQLDTYRAVVEKLVLPYSLNDLIFQPWSIFTYPFFTAGFEVLFLLMAGMLTWQFGRIHQQLLGEFRTGRLLMLAVPVIGLLTVTSSTFISFRELPAGAMPSFRQAPSLADSPRTPIDSNETEIIGQGSLSQPGPTPAKGPRVQREFLYASTLISLSILLMMGCVAVTPDFSVSLFPFGMLKIKWVGLMVLMILLFWTALSPMAFSILIGGALGMLHVVSLKRDLDITEVVWSYYKDKTPRPKMKVKHGGGRKDDERYEAGFGGPKLTSGEISQEIIDQILDKISEKGYNSLSREEKELLYRASQDDQEKKK